MGSPKEEKTRNLGDKPIASSIKQVVQEDGKKTWKDTKLRRGDEQKKPQRTLSLEEVSSATTTV